MAINVTTYEQDLRSTNQQSTNLARTQCQTLGLNEVTVVSFIFRLILL